MFVGYSDPLNPNGSDKDQIFLNEFSGPGWFNPSPVWLTQGQKYLSAQKIY